MAEIRRVGSVAMLAACALIIALGAGVSIALPWHADAAAAGEPVTYRVVIEQMRFDPPTLTVKRGDRVQWVNRDLVAHTASSSAKLFDSGSMAPNASWTYVAGRSGSYPYQCNFHPTMHGTLNVR
jgi:plastocyanin